MPHDDTRIRIDVHHFVHFMRPDLSGVTDRLDHLQASVDALSDATITDPAKLAALRDKLKASSDSLAAAVAANTPTTAP